MMYGFLSKCRTVCNAVSNNVFFCRKMFVNSIDNITDGRWYLFVDSVIMFVNSIDNITDGRWSLHECFG